MAPALSTQLQLSTTVEFETVSNNASSIYLMATITAPEVEDKRTPVDVTCVIDRSGSMSGEKIALMKETLSFMVEQLHDNDKLSLVVFDDQVDTLLPLTNMTAQSKVQATKLIESIQVDGSTNLSGALFEALDICKGRKVANDVGSIILFTDGRANKGILKTEDILTGLNGYLKLMKKPINVFTLGFGGDHDENMLKSISEAGSGTYYYITKNDEIPQAFSDCLGGLLSVTSQNIKLKFEVMKGVTLKAIHSNYKKLSTDQILLGDIYAEETKDVVIEVEIEKSQHDVDNFELVNFTLSYYNVLEKEPEDLEVTASVNRSNKSVPSTPNERLEQQKVRVQHAEALLQSKAAADKGDYETARTVLKCQIKREEESPFAKSNAYFGQLATEMNDMIHHFESPQIYREKGSKVLISKWSESNYQRSSEPTSEYATRKKRSVYSNYLSKAKK